MDFRRVCSVQQWLPWVDSPTAVTVRWYRTAPGTPSIGFFHTAGSTDFIPYRPKDLIPIQPGMQPYPTRYDKGAAPFYIGTKQRPCGSPAAWMGAYAALNPPLVYDAATGVAVCCGVPPLGFNYLLLTNAPPLPQPPTAWILETISVASGPMVLAPAGTPSGTLLLSSPIPSPAGKLVLRSPGSMPEKPLRFAPTPAWAGKLVLHSPPFWGLLLGGSGTLSGHLSLGSPPPPMPTVSELLLSGSTGFGGSLDLAPVSVLAGGLALSGSTDSARLLLSGQSASGAIVLASPASTPGSLALRSPASPSGHLEFRQIPPDALRLVDPASPAGRLALSDPGAIAGRLSLGGPPPPPPPPPPLIGHLVLGGTTMTSGLRLMPSGSPSGNLILTNAPPVPSPHYLVFPGNAYVVNTSSASGWPTAPFSVSLRFRTSASPGLPAFLFVIGFSSGSGSTQSWYFYQEGSTLYASFGASGATSAAVPVNDGNWHNAIATYDGTLLQIYLDGLASGVPVTVSYTIVQALVFIGSAPITTYAFAGDLFDVRIFSYVLSAPEILAIAGGDTSTTPFGDLRQWNCTEGTGTTCADSSGNSDLLEFEVSPNSPSWGT